MDKLVSKRGGIRGSNTKLLEKIENFLKDVNVDENKSKVIESIRGFIAQLNEKEKNLKDINEQIENLCTAQEIAAEVETSLEITEKIIDCKSRLNYLLDTLITPVSLPTSEVTNSGSQPVQMAREIKTKLPRLEIPKFFGEASNWLSFWNQYENSIHSNNTLTKIEKFNYLKMFVGGNALSAISGFSLSNDNYDSAIQLLKERFGRNDMLINAHMNALLNISALKHSNDIINFRKLFDKAEIQIRSLKTLGVTTKMYGSLLCPILLKIIPPDLALEYNRNRNDENENWDLEELMEFLRKELESRERALSIHKKEFVKYQNIDHKRSYDKQNASSAVAFNTMSNSKFCIFCRKNSHYGINCKNLSDEEKRKMLKREGRCYKCFRKSHLSSECRTKLQPCEKCSKSNHNKLFCFQKVEDSKVVSSDTSDDNNTIVSSSQCDNSEPKYGILLQTCSVIAHSRNKSKLITILMDSGSERSFICSDLAHELKLPLVRKELLKIYSFGGKYENEKEFDVFRLELKNRNNAKSRISVEVLATDVISGTEARPPTDVNIKKIMQQKGFKLSDFSNLLGSHDKKISVLLGAEYFCTVNKGRPIKVEKDLFVLPTIFGLTLMGKTKQFSNKINSFFISADEKETFDIQSFWKLESLGIIDSNESLSLDDLNAINLFHDHLKFNDGRYETSLLWKENKSKLNNNFVNAKGRFLSLKNKLKCKKWVLEEYNNIIEEQLQNKIIQECKLNENASNCYYMPHRPVIREDKSTTKVRIVFDASSKEKNAKSLNECLHSGPNLNPNLLDIILKFRIFNVVFSADIEKAFHQIKIIEDERDFLRFLWFNTEDDMGFIVLKMNRVTFGVTSSPFILASTIKHHIKKYEKEFPDVVYMLNNFLYVDDVYYGADTDDEVFSLSSNAVKIFKDASMNLRKFQTNSENLKNMWANNGFITEERKSNEGPLKALGIIWNPEEDNLMLDIKEILNNLTESKITKRLVLSTIAKIYDPVGFISPFVIRIKFLMQELWKLGLDWDTELPDKLCKEFKEWCLEVKELLNLHIPRKYFLNNNITKFAELELFVFCDASMKGYGTVSYFRDPKSLNTAFILSKSRVSPLKKLSLPRLELMAALIASRMASYLTKLFGIIQQNTYCFSDSQIVLHWIKGSANKWKPFVANRVQEIQNLIDPSRWKYCRSEENPADAVSRGTAASYLMNNENWSHGPTWLREGNLKHEFSNTLTSQFEEQLKKEERKTIVNVATCKEFDFDLFIKYSSWTKLKRVVSYCLRFMNNCRNPNEKITSFLTVKELDNAENLICKIVQNREFNEEIKILRAGKSLNASNKLLPLSPFLDKEGILRVGGRLSNSKLGEDQKHQIILPKNHPVSKLILSYFHVKNLHGGTSSTVLSSRQKFWIVNCRDVVRKIIRNCMNCFRNRANTASQIMADLPTARVVPNRVFSKIGVDFAGPFLIKTKRGRGVKPYKIYVCLFICFTTKAIHLEVVSDLTSEAFIASLKRFVARRGKPLEIFSDRGTNFVGAEREFKRILNMLNSDERFYNYITEEGIRWNFNPPAAPHFGGIWEAGVKQMKAHLKRTVGMQILTYEEFDTLITQIEACLNSRPIMDMSNDPNDLQPLTPGHFIIGTSLTAIPELDVSNEKLCPSERWKLVQQLYQSFWKRWSSDYLCQLQGRSKWLKDKPNLDIGDLVLIKDDLLPPLKWKLGRIIQTFPGKDEKVRVVKLKTFSGELTRPIKKLSLLPFVHL